jgi:hypothetical protein
MLRKVKDVSFIQGVSFIQNVSFIFFPEYDRYIA